MRTIKDISDAELVTSWRANARFLGVTDDTVNALLAEIQRRGLHVERPRDLYPSRSDPLPSVPLWSPADGEACPLV